MSAPKHTPGPWFRDQHGHVYGWTPTEYGKSSVLLIDSRYSDATIADKNLIAAAPELLEALKACIQCFDEMTGRKPAFVEDSIAMGNEAIAKATGSAS